MNVAQAYRHAPPALPPDTPPTLAVVVDTEEEFDWAAPLSRHNRSVRSIACQSRAHEIYDDFGIVPTYVIDHCVATDEHAVDFLAGLRSEGRCRIGAHLHTWITPPFEEEVSDRTSYQCNLPLELERAKIDTLTRAITDAFGEAPVVFKAGRYGFGRNTRALLIAAGYKLDCSFVPYTDYSARNGPSFLNSPPFPFWLDDARSILEVPLTKGFIGAAAGIAAPCQGFFDQHWFQSLRVGGVLSRSRLLARSLLSPEGVTAQEQIRLLNMLLAAGQRVFTLTYHSPSLAPGNTPYVCNDGDLEEFLDRIRAVVAFFSERVGGRFSTIEEVYGEALCHLDRPPTAARNM